jgi:hypothetical protein
MPIDVAITRAAGAPDVRTADLRQQHQVFTFPSDTEPASVVLDPNAWVVMRAVFEKR